MRRFLALVAAIVAVLVLLPSPSKAVVGVSGSSASDPIEIGHIPECFEAVPAAIGLPGDVVNLDVRVLLDGVPLAQGQQVIADASRSYTPLGIAVRPTYESASFSSADAEEILAQAKARFGGARPAGSDVVLVLTTKDIYVEGIGNGVAGLADCIGGVAFPENAFAVGEVRNTNDGLLNYKMPAKIAAHEVGHLMGGHHHYANCVEGVVTELDEGDVSPCTLMFNLANGTSFNFSTVNGVVVRGHAEAYARP